MPYVVINAFHKDEETMHLLAEKVCVAVQEAVGCPASAVTVAVNEITRDDWAHIQEKELPENMEHILILSGKKQY